MEDPTDSSAAEATTADSHINDPADVEATLLRTVQEQSERDYYENAIISSLASDGKVDDSALTEAALLEQVKQESARDARQQEDQRMPNTIEASSNAEGLTDHMNQRAGMSTTAVDLARLSEEEALELAMLASLSNQNHHTGTSFQIQSTGANSGSSRSNSSSNGVTVVPSAVPNHDMHQFHTEEELLQMALQASMEGYAVPSATWADHNLSSATASASTSSSMRPAPTSGGYAINIGAPYVNVASNNDYSEDMDEELMRAIEASLRK